MILTSFHLAGAYRIEPQPIAAERGAFARRFCEDECGEQELARADADMAARCDVIPDGSMVASIGATHPVGGGAAR
jgi:hypothetical protein